MCKRDVSRGIGIRVVVVTAPKLRHTEQHADALMCRFEKGWKRAEKPKRFSSARAPKGRLVCLISVECLARGKRDCPRLFAVSSKPLEVHRNFEGKIQNPKC